MGIIRNSVLAIIRVKLGISRKPVVNIKSPKVAPPGKIAVKNITRSIPGNM
jgi:hypothetical protein